jgi:hypothetical protein
LMIGAYWHFFTVTVDYNSSHIEFLLTDFCLTNQSLKFVDEGRSL